MSNPRDRIVVEQLDQHRWHVLLPCGIPTDETGYLGALTGALWWGMIDGLLVEARPLDGSVALVMKAGEPRRQHSRWAALTSGRRP